MPTTAAKGLRRAAKSGVIDTEFTYSFRTSSDAYVTVEGADGMVDLGLENDDKGLYTYITPGQARSLANALMRFARVTEGQG